MICPYCGEDDDKVIDSRASEGGMAIRRRRECLGCHRRYTSYERIEKTARIVVVKKDGTRVAFDGSKILAGIQAACGKRPIPEDFKVKLAREVEDEVHREFEREVPSVEVGQRVATRLRRLDEISYIRFASEHLEFRTLDEFAEELSDLQARPKDLPNQQALFPDGT